MFLDKNLLSSGVLTKPELYSFLLPVMAVVIFIFTASAFSQDQPILAPTQPAIKLNSAEFVGQDGLTIDRFVICKVKNPFRKTRRSR